MNALYSFACLLALAGSMTGQSAPGGAPTGLDVSGHSGAVDWAAVAAAGHDFVFVKATEGVDLEDPGFRAHWSGAARAGLRRGAYHFYVTEDHPEEQARFFLRTLGEDRGELLPVVDVELIGHGTRPGWAADLARFLKLLEAELGRRPILYTSPGFWDREVAGRVAAEALAGLAAYPLWLAEYGVEEPRLPKGFSGWRLWQFEGDASVPGVEKSADLSRPHPDGGLEALLLGPSAPGR